MDHVLPSLFTLNRSLNGLSHGIIPRLIRILKDSHAKWSNKRQVEDLLFQ
jgi:hypothetical protein